MFDQRGLFDLGSKIPLNINRSPQKHKVLFLLSISEENHHKNT